ncbi:OmpA/MotB family protein [Aminipila luticellarii]|uniref:Chemotaxis protein MotB n=1 Tax=Aminipila luticellarii TaxID=2507160 RepID=A0A410PXZ3_9FIRM|nr:flagellar motor protein MotB [Aminipila luticellarii]QAT43847.1 chemotaxis protein MotB [Aminipila luticellarii]
MKKRSIYEEEEKDNRDRWLLTYSDMITLLLALFIIMYSMSTINEAKFRAVAENMGHALNNPRASELFEQKDKGSKSEDQDMEKLAQEVKDYIKKNNLDGQVEVTGTESYVKIDLKDTLLFIPDSDQLINGNSEVLLELKDLIQEYYSQVSHIVIKGHTAFVPGTDEQFSWELSSNRALTVVQYLTENGMTPDKFSIEGYSHYAPAANNNTEEGRAKNRRVEIYITKQ